MINVPKPEVLKAGIKHAEEHLNQWNQCSWADGDVDTAGQPTCGTTACLAGHILLSQGVPWEMILVMPGISEAALDALGFDREDDARRVFEGNIFGSTGLADVDEDFDDWANHKNLSGIEGIEVFEKFKAFVSRQTGMDLS